MAGQPRCGGVEVLIASVGRPKCAHIEGTSVTSVRRLVCSPHRGREGAGQPKSGSGWVAAASIFHPVGDGSAARLLSENTQCTAVEKSKRLLSGAEWVPCTDPCQGSLGAALLSASSTVNNNWYTPTNLRCIEYT